MAAHHDFTVRNLVCWAAWPSAWADARTVDAPSLPRLLALVQLACFVFEFSVSGGSSSPLSRDPDERGDFDWKTVRRIFSFSLYVVLLSVAPVSASRRIRS